MAIDKAIGENGFKVVTLLRLSPLLPFSLGNYLYGLTSVKFVPYVLGRSVCWWVLLHLTADHYFIFFQYQSNWFNTTLNTAFFFVGVSENVKIKRTFKQIKRKRETGSNRLRRNYVNDHTHAQIMMKEYLWTNSLFLKWFHMKIQSLLIPKCCGFEADFWQSVMLKWVICGHLFIFKKECTSDNLFY